MGDIPGWQQVVNGGTHRPPHLIMRRQQGLGKEDVGVSESLGEEAALRTGLQIQELRKLLRGGRVVEAMGGEDVEMEEE